MVNHPNRSTHAFRFIAFSTITQNSLAHDADARGALDKAAELHREDTDFLEVIDFGTGGRKVWQNEVPLHRAREGNRTVFRGEGYAPGLAAIEMEG